MENLYNDLHRTGKSFETAITLKLPTRPKSSSNPNPKVFEDFGSSLAPASQKSKIKPASIVSPKPTCSVGIKKPIADFLDSEDELDFLSSSQADPDDFRPSKKADKHMDKKGRRHDFDHKFPPEKPNVLAKLKFNKIKKPLGAEDSMTGPPSSSSSLRNQAGFKENGPDFASWANDLKNQSVDKQQAIGDISVFTPLHVKSSNQRLSPPQSLPKQPIQPKVPNTSRPSRPKPRPLPRPSRKSNADAGGSKPPNNTGSGLTTWKTPQFLELIPLGRAKPATTTRKKKNPSRSPSPEISISTPKKKDGPGSQPSSTKSFPMDMISPLREKEQQKPLPEPRSKVYVNPLSFEASPKPKAYPMPSPQSTDKVGTRATSQSNKARPFPLDDLDGDEGDEESDYNASKRKVKAKGKQKSQHKPQAFPMPTQMLASIGPRNVPKEKLMKHHKRLSENCSDDERRKKKKRRSSLPPSQYSFEDEGDSITISPDTDPRTLCPYCDIPLPSSPSLLLINILAATRKKSTRDPRPSNPLGLKAPLAIFIVVCQRHKFESQMLPEAERKGWPKTIQWQKLGERVERMKDELQALIEDPGGEREADDDVNKDIDEVERVFRDDADETRRKGSKARSIFWTEVMDEVKKKGSRVIVGVRGQFANFEKTQPGYYGEQGSVIIHQILFDMFPPASFDPTRISPLTSNEFVLRVLVPEVALRLIMDDRNLEGNDGMYQALTVLRESSAYGVAMFPEDGGESRTGKNGGDDVMGIGDKIVMERARKRRKELEEEEAEEEREAARIAEMETEMEQAGGKEKMASKKKPKGKQRDERQPEYQEAPIEKSRPRPRPIAKGSSTISVLPPSDYEEVPQPQQSFAPHKSPRKRTSRTRSMYSGMDTDRSDGFSSSAIGLNASESDDRHRPKDRKRSPSASELRSEQTKGKARKPSSSSSRATDRDPAVLNIESESDASLGHRTSTKLAERRSSRKKVMQRSNSIMEVDVYDRDGDDVDLKTPVCNRSRFSDYRRAEDASNDEQTPKPLMLPQTDRSNDIKPLLAARMRQSQKNNSESEFGEGDMPRRTSNLLGSAAIHVLEDAGTNEEPDSYKWLLNDTSQSSTSSNTARRY